MHDALPTVGFRFSGSVNFRFLYGVRAGTIEWPLRIVAGANRTERPSRRLQLNVSTARNVLRHEAHRCSGGVSNIAGLLPKPAARPGGCAPAVAGQLCNACSNWHRGCVFGRLGR